MKTTHTRKIALELSEKLHKSFSYDENDCWLWIGCTTVGGYGLLTYKQRNYYVHRLMAAHYLFNFKESDHIMHTCDVRRCMNPEHLMLGSILLNNQDMFEKRRARPQGQVPMQYKGKPYEEVN